MVAISTYQLDITNVIPGQSINVLQTHYNVKELINNITNLFINVIKCSLKYTIGYIVYLLSF